MSSSLEQITLLLKQVDSGRQKLTTHRKTSRNRYNAKAKGQERAEHILSGYDQQYIIIGMGAFLGSIMEKIYWKTN